MSVDKKTHPWQNRCKCGKRKHRIFWREKNATWAKQECVNSSVRTKAASVRIIQPDGSIVTWINTGSPAYKRESADLARRARELQRQVNSLY